MENRTVLIKSDGTQVPFPDAEITETILAERHAALKQLEEDVAAVSEINEVLSRNVHAQDEPLSYLDYLIDDARDNVVSGTTNLMLAEKHQLSYRKKIWAVAATLGTVALGLVGVAVLTKTAPPKQ